MPKDSDKSKKMLSKKQNGFSDSESDSDYNYVEDIVSENMELSPQELSNRIMELFPLKTKKEKKKQLEKIKQFKKQEMKRKMKELKKSTRGRKDPESDGDGDSSAKLRSAFDKIKQSKSK